MQDMEKRIGQQLPFYDGFKDIPKVFMTFNKSVLQNIPFGNGDPNTGVPPEERTNPINPNPLMASKPIIWMLPAICNAHLDEDDDTVGHSILGYHGEWHNTRGGVLLGSGSPSAPIFYCFHVFITDIYLDWKSCKSQA